MMSRGYVGSMHEYSVSHAIRAQQSEEPTKLDVSKLAFLGFLLIFPLDLMSYTLRGVAGVSIPVGTLGVAAGIVLIPLCMSVHGRTRSLRLAIVFLLLSPIAVASLSPQFRWIDVYFWLRAAGLFSLGFFFVAWLAGRAGGSLWIVGAWLACSVLCLTIPRTAIAQEHGNYLRVADAMMVTSFAVLATIRSRRWYWVVAAISLACLYAVGSRASLGITAIAVVALGAIRHRLEVRVALAAASIPVAVVAGYYASIRFRELSSIHDDRLLRLLFAPSLDTSLAARRSLSTEAWLVFLANPIVGDYRYYARGGSLGGYAHNFLSLWSELGVVGIVISVAVLVTGVGALWRAGRCLGDAASRFLFLTALAVILGMVFAKSHLWSFMYFAFGGVLALAGRDERVQGRVFAALTANPPGLSPGDDVEGTKGSVVGGEVITRPDRTSAASARP